MAVTKMIKTVGQLADGKWAGSTQAATGRAMTRLRQLMVVGPNEATGHRCFAGASCSATGTLVPREEMGGAEANSGMPQAYGA